MAGIEECKALCEDNKFLAVLDVARGNLGMQTRLAHDPLTADPIRKHRFIGLVVRKDKNGEYKLGTIGTDAWDGRECFQNGPVCTWRDIFQEVAIVVAAPPSYRLTSIMGRGDPDVSYFKGRLVVDKAVLHKNGDTCWQRTKPSFLEQRK